MKPSYEDIVSRIKEEPLWFTQKGVPRYIKFHPDHRSNIYADAVKLIRIKCQFCEKNFLVELCSKEGSTDFASVRFKENLYGDPPNVSCCIGGPTATSTFIDVVESWELSNNGRWVSLWK